MKVIITSLFLLLSVFLQAQTLAERVAQSACVHLDSISDKQVLQDSIKGSIVAAVTQYFIQGDEEARALFNTVEGIQKFLDEVYDVLPHSCEKVKQIMLEDKRYTFYCKSKSDAANKYYEEGTLYLQNGKYRKAIKPLKKAIKADPYFVIAIDHLAVSYRKLEKFKKAIKYYNRSLAIYPEGDLAILNIAVIYSFIDKPEQAVYYYQKLRNLYPDNPEGYFGLAKMYYLLADYENALDNVFIAHKMYLVSQSEYSQDSEMLIGLIAEEMKNANQLEVLNKKALEHNVDIVIE